MIRKTLLRFFISLALVLSTLTPHSLAGTRDSHPILARITFYTGKQKVAWSQGPPRAIQGITMAAHPKFKMGTAIHIPALTHTPIDTDGKFVIQDRGPDVTSMRASKGKRLVFDVFIDPTNKTALRFAKTLPENMEVFVVNK